MRHFDWGMFWAAVGGLAGCMAVVATIWFGLLSRRRLPFKLKVQAVMDFPRRAIKVILTSGGEGEVREVSVVRGRRNDIYPTTAEFLQSSRLPHYFKAGEMLEFFLRPSKPVADHPATFDVGSGKSTLKVFVRPGRGKPRRFPIRVEKNLEWPATSTGSASRDGKDLASRDGKESPAGTP